MEEAALTKDVPQQSAEAFISDVRRKFTAEEKICAAIKLDGRESVGIIARKSGLRP